ncbi:MAG: hypothetical protein U1C97_02140 [Candidatus Gracilibacteria bacterium]|nr:hypothetical protein [Candidatus Gracilibacteria bacterium]
MLHFNHIFHICQSPLHVEGFGFEGILFVGTQALLEPQRTGGTNGEVPKFFFNVVLALFQLVLADNQAGVFEERELEAGIERESGKRDPTGTDQSTGRKMFSPDLLERV